MCVHQPCHPHTTKHPFFSVAKPTGRIPSPIALTLQQNATRGTPEISLPSVLHQYEDPSKCTTLYLKLLATPSPDALMATLSSQFYQDKDLNSSLPEDRITGEYISVSAYSLPYLTTLQH